MDRGNHVNEETMMISNCKIIINYKWDMVVISKFVLGMDYPNMLRSAGLFTFVKTTVAK